MEIVEIARQHNLIIFADEIYDKFFTTTLSITQLRRWHLTC